MTAVHAPVIEQAARGELPEWTEATAARRAHMKQVAALLGRWAERMGLDAAECARWRATGWLHDCQRDASAETLLPWVDPPFADLPESFLHGPATAARLEAEGCLDGDLLDAIRYHTLAQPRLGRLGKALIAADYLEPGRRSRLRWRARLRQRAPADFDAVVRHVVRAKLERGLDSGLPLGFELVGLWNALTA